MKKFNFTDLILIVGTNPLPNYVVAYYFLVHEKYAQCKNIWLVHSDKTHSLAMNLRDVLLKVFKNQKVNIPSFKFVQVSAISQAKVIENEIENMIQKLDSSVHFNYTGGTKVMGIHVYRTLENCKDIDCEFSYLDARTLKLYNDNGQKINKQPLEKSVQISFCDMIKLHGFIERVSNNKNYDYILPLYQQLIDKDQILNEYYEKVDGKHKKRDFEKSKDISMYPSCVQEILRNLNVVDDLGKTTSKITKHKKFLESGWLEAYICNCIKDFGYDELWVGKHIYKEKKWTKNQDFELDVVAIKGYQLFGISCTAAGVDKKDYALCKSKGFEIILRTKQIGGDEAKAVLITSLEEEKAERLKQELISDNGGEPNIEVLGIESWKKDRLAKDINNFFNQRS